MKQEKVCAYIGRFQTYTNGHHETNLRALEKYDHLVIVVGSVEKARDSHDPFTFEERKSVIEHALATTVSGYLTNGTPKKVSVVPVHDFHSNQKWLSEVQQQVSSVTQSSDITLTGYDKDDSSFYLKFFPQWKQDFVTEHFGGIDATTVRKEFFATGKILGDIIPQETVRFLESFKANKADVYQLIHDEQEFIKWYKEVDMKDVPYMMPSLTGDSIVTCAGHILIGVRKNLPGKGLWCVPGGFFKNTTSDGTPVDYDQVDSAIRELREETKLKVPEPVLRGCIRDTYDFTDPKRSLRWRIMTKAVYIVLNDTKLPKVKGSDDLHKAFWVPINEVVENRDKFFEDHLQIIDHFLGIL